jgi:hypothetical protein
VPEFTEDVSSWWWWISVVVLSLLLNLASSYLKPLIDRRWARWSEARQRDLEERSARFQEAVQRLADDPQEQILLAIAMLQNRVRSVLYWVLGGMIMYGFGQMFDLSKSPETWNDRLIHFGATFPFMLCAISALRESSSAFRRARLIDAARRMKGGLVVVGPWGRPEDGQSKER